MSATQFNFEFGFFTPGTKRARDVERSDRMKASRERRERRERSERIDKPKAIKIERSNKAKVEIQGPGRMPVISLPRKAKVEIETPVLYIPGEHETRSSEIEMKERLIQSRISRAMKDVCCVSDSEVRFEFQASNNSTKFVTNSCSVPAFAS